MKAQIVKLSKKAQIVDHEPIKSNSQINEKTFEWLIWVHLTDIKSDNVINKLILKKEWFKIVVF